MTDRRLRILLVTTAVLLAPLIARASNPQPAFAVRVEGSGPAMILIPGFVSSGAVWDDVVAHYKTRRDRCEAVTALASVLPGALGGVAGVLGGTRQLTRDARDDEERVGVRRFRLVASLVAIVFALAFPVGSLLTGWRPWSAVNFVMFVATLAALYGVWLPKILRRRFEAELREDPARALARRRRERRAAMPDVPPRRVFAMSRCSRLSPPHGPRGLVQE